MLYDRLDSLVIYLERRLGKPVAAALVPLGLMVAAGIYVRPALSTVALGRHYAFLAEDFFKHYSSSVMIHRFLTPLISYLLGLRGELIIVTNLLFAWLLLILVFTYFRKQAPYPGDALLAAITIAFSLTTLTTIYYGGYTDSLTYVLIFAAWWQTRHRILLYLFFTLGLFNRESIVFLIPWFVYLRVSQAEDKPWELFESCLFFALILTADIILRNWISSFSVEGFSVRYYLEPLLDDPLHWVRESYTYWTVGLFSVFKVFWLFPILACVGLWKDRQFRDLISIAILLVCVSLQLVVAFDSSRMLTMAFPVMIISLLYLMRSESRPWRAKVGWILLVNVLLPQIYTARDIVELMHSVPVNVVLIWLFGKSAW